MKNYLLIIIFTTLIFQSCYKEPDFTNFDYETYNRIIGPDGGIINFYSNYSNDSKNDVLVSLDVPIDALDSVMVFNMYQFEEYELVMQMDRGFSSIGSKFLYFVPFYESQGYHERSQLDISYHLSVEFNKPITITYNFLAEDMELSAENWQQAELYSDYYKRTNMAYRLFRIKIPKLDEWGENNNIYVNWNTQGYPNGYDRTDLNYIISGLWSSLDDWGNGETGLENWEEVTDFELNISENSVSYEINNTDYIYVLSRKLQIDIVDIPINIRNDFLSRFPDLQIERAARDGNYFNLYLDDNTYATFTKKGEFVSLTNDQFRISNLPPIILSHIKAKYPNQTIKKVIYTQYSNSGRYELILSDGVKAYYDGTGRFIYDSRYGVEQSELPADAITYLQQNHPGELITNVTSSEYDFGDNSYYIYIIYLSSNAKVSFARDYGWINTLYYALQQDDLPEGVTQYFVDNYPNSDFIEINYTESPEGEEYEIYLIDDKWFLFNGQSELQQKEIGSLEEDDLPVAITSYINTNYPYKSIAEIYYFYYNYGADGADEGYDIYFVDMLNIEFEPDGTINALYGKRRDHLPLTYRNYVDIGFPDEEIINCRYDRYGYSYTNPQGITYYYNWELIFASNMRAGLDLAGNIIFREDYIVKKTLTETTIKKEEINSKRTEVHKKFKELKIK
ncbi:MAG: PepSY-like domain-containing protein [Bacteroidota bacterium]